MALTLLAAASGLSRPELLTQAPAVSQKVEPEYTRAARRAGIEGTVLLYAVIGTDGRPQRVRVMKGLGYGLDEKALEAVAQWRFDPGIKDRVVVATPVTLAVEFRLGGGGPVRI